MTNDFEEIATLDAAGALTPDERRTFERTLAGASLADRALVAELRNVMASVAASQADSTPSDELRVRLLARISETGPPPAPGFSFVLAREDNWIPYPVPGIRMKVLAVNGDRGYATVLLDVAPGSRFPAHHHGGAEECYVISGSVYACGRRIGAGDFHHADAGSDHTELWTDEGCRVLLVVDPDDYLPAPAR